MDKWIPFLQSLIWPVFLAVLLYFFRNWFRELLEAIKSRVESGSEMSVGPSGFSLGSAPKLDDTDDGSGRPPEQIFEEVQKRPALNEMDMELSKYFRLVHSASYNPEYSREQGRAYYTLRVSLDADNETMLDKVSKVVYHLHPTFPNPDREVTTRDNNFEFMTYAWGQFNLTADVYFIDDEEKPLKLFRYLNF